MNRTVYAVASVVFATCFSVALAQILLSLHRLYSMRHLGTEAFGSFLTAMSLPMFFMAFLLVVCGAACVWAFAKAVGNSKVQPPSFF